MTGGILPDITFDDCSLIRVDATLAGYRSAIIIKCAPYTVTVAASRQLISPYAQGHYARDASWSQS